MSDLKTISNTISWYDRLPRDFSDIETLISARRKLSTSLFKVAQNLATLGVEKSNAEHSRKAFEARRRHELMNAETKPVKSHIDVQVSNEAEAYLNAENAAESEYQALRIMYSAALNVCDVMNQHIANLRSEKSRELSGIGSQ